MDLSRRERRKLEVRYRILEAAVSLFNERGIRETKVSEISERADVAHKTFFNHFPSKQHLLRALAEDALRQILVDIEEVRKQGRTTRERIELFFSSLADNAGEAGPMHRELITELVHALHDSQEESELVRRLHDSFAEIVADGVEAGELRASHDVETLTDVVLGTYYSLIFNWAHRDGFPLRERATAAASFLASALGPEEET
jgi:AcrR family transcriptional regulator